MSDLVSYQLQDGIATPDPEQRQGQRHFPAVIDAFNQALDQSIQDKAVVIITGQPGILSGGYDLKEMMKAHKTPWTWWPRAAPWRAACCRTPSP